MARLAREEVFAHDEIAVIHVMARTVRRCFLFGDDELTGRCFNHRKPWIEAELRRLASGFGIDLICFAVMSNHFHLVLRSRPDVVETWDDTEVARRWLRLCPKRKGFSEPTEAELNSIRLDRSKVEVIRARLSDISWWMRLLCQRVAQRANKEDQEVGKFWQSRFRAVRLLDEESILACAAYVDLNPIRAAVAETLETSDYTSIQRRIEALAVQSTPDVSEPSPEIDAGNVSDKVSRDNVNCKGDLHNRVNSTNPIDDFLAPVAINAVTDALGPQANDSGKRASDKGFATMSAAAYIELLDWTARQFAEGKNGSTPPDTPEVFKRLSIAPNQWHEMVGSFGKLFSVVAGRPQTVDSTRSKIRRKRYHMRTEARKLLAC